MAPQPGELLFLIDPFFEASFFFGLVGGKKVIMKIHEDSYTVYRCVFGQFREVVNYWMTSFLCANEHQP